MDLGDSILGLPCQFGEARKNATPEAEAPSDLAADGCLSMIPDLRKFRSTAYPTHPR